MVVPLNVVAGTKKKSRQRFPSLIESPNKVGNGSRRNEGRLPVIVMQRVIRSKDSKSGKLVGAIRTATDIAHAITLAKRSRKVYSFIDSEGNEGIIRSGRKMRTCDSHVRNTLQNGFFVK